MFCFERPSVRHLKIFEKSNETLKIKEQLLIIHNFIEILKLRNEYNGKIKVRIYALLTWINKK